jgi:hypothetical protein
MQELDTNIEDEALETEFLIGLFAIGHEYRG